MMINIITIHDIGNNFGSTLQACSLAEFLELHGYEVEILNYRPAYAYNRGKLVYFLKCILFFRDVIVQKHRFKTYFKKHAKLTKRYKTLKQLKSAPMVDAYIVGSDQVWNEFYDAGKDPAYYLDFTNSPNKLSYSSSLGQLHTWEELERLKRKLADFKYIAVREKASVAQLHEIGITHAKHVLDPVFLFEKEYYISREMSNRYGNYVLIYSVNNDDLMNQVAKQIANIYGLKIILIGGFVQKFDADYYLKNIGPKEFCNLIYHAKYVVANSFHATAMAIILNKQFCVVLSKYSPLRITDMLEVAGLNDRLISDLNNLELVFHDIDYEKVNEKINIMKRESQQYLLGSLQKISDGV